MNQLSKYALHRNTPIHSLHSVDGSSPSISAVFSPTIFTEDKCKINSDKSEVLMRSLSFLLSLFWSPSHPDTWAFQLSMTAAVNEMV